MARGKNYTLPIPADWAKADPPAGADVVLREIARPQPDYSLANIVITPIAPSNPPFNPTDEAACKQTGQAMAGPLKGTLKSTGLVDGPTGKTCQVDLLLDQGKRDNRYTVIKGPHDTWGMTCSYDLRDTAALAKCSEALRGFKFD